MEEVKGAVLFAYVALASSRCCRTFGQPEERSDARRGARVCVQCFPSARACVRRLGCVATGPRPRVRAPMRGSSREELCGQLGKVKGNSHAPREAKNRNRNTKNQKKTPKDPRNQLRIAHISLAECR